MSRSDAYKKIRPPTEVERCECASVKSLVLVDLLTNNPIHCGVCRNEIDPERLQLTVEETEAIANWAIVAGAFYRLWLNSGEYEQYAKDRLLDPEGEINIEGRRIARNLSAKWPTRLWLFSDADDGEPTHCPYCQQPLDKNVKWGTGCCSECHIQI